MIKKRSCEDGYKGMDRSGTVSLMRRLMLTLRMDTQEVRVSQAMVTIRTL